MTDRLVADLVVDGCGPGASPASSATPATASTRCMGRCGAPAASPAVRAGAPRGERRADGGRPREVHRRGRRRDVSTQGPGAVHLLNGLYDAKLDHQPVVAIVGQQPTHGARLGVPAGDRPGRRSSRTSRRSSCRPCWRRSRPPWCVDRAFRTALATRVARASWCCRTTCRTRRRRTSRRTSTASCRRPPEWRRAARRAARRRPARGRRGAQRRRARRAARRPGRPGTPSAQVRAVAERLGAGVTTSLLGKPWWDESLPTSCGVMGHLGTTASRLADGPLRHPAGRRQQRPVDRVLPRARPGARRAGRHRRPPPRQPLPGRGRAHRRRRRDARAPCCPLLDERADTSWRDEVEEQVERWHGIAEERAAAAGRARSTPSSSYAS